MNKKRLAVIAGVVSLALVVMALPLMTACAAPAEEEEAEKVYEWRSQGAYVWEDPSQKSMPMWCAKIAKDSGGRIVITPYAEAEIVPTSEILEAVGKGVVALGQGQLSYYSGSYPVLDSVCGYPYTFVDTPECSAECVYRKLFSSGLNDVWEEALEPANVTVLTHFSWGEYPGLYGKEPINSIEDFKGKRMRLNPPFDKLFAKVGAETLWIPGAEQYMALKLGTIDIASWDCTAYRSMQWYEVAPYYYRPNLVDHSIGWLGINLELFNSLPDDLQKVVRDAGEWYSLWYLENATYIESVWVTEHQEELGYQVWTLDPAIVDELRAVGVEVLEEFAEQDDLCARATAILKKEFMGVE